MNFEKKMKDIINILKPLDIDNIDFFQYIVGAKHNFIDDDDGIIERHKDMFNEYEKHIKDILEEFKDSFYNDNNFHQGFGLSICGNLPYFCITDTIHKGNPIVTSFMSCFYSPKYFDYYQSKKGIDKENSILFNHMEEYLISLKPSKNAITDWEQSRLTRRTSPDGMFMIDPGCNLVCDLSTEYGAPLQFSCEGHPRNSYLLFHYPNEPKTIEFMNCLEETGLWKYRYNGYGVKNERGLYMIDVQNEEHKKEIWEETIAHIKELVNNKNNSYKIR